MERSAFFGALVAAAASPAGASAQDGPAALWHVAVFRFAPDRIEAAIAAFRTMRDASRSHPGNISYDVFRSSEDAGSFFIVERWSSQAALDAHEQTPVFISVGQKVLTATAELHDSVTGVALSP